SQRLRRLRPKKSKSFCEPGHTGWESHSCVTCVRENGHYALERAERKAVVTAARTCAMSRSLSLPLCARRTRTFLFLGAQTLGSVGPKSKMQFAAAAAARCEIPLSCPTKIVCSRTAARCGSDKFFAKRTSPSFHSCSNCAVCAFSASPETTTRESCFLTRPDSSFAAEKWPLLGNNSIQFCTGQFFSLLPLPG